LRESLEMVVELIRQVRELSLTLRPPILDDLGLLPALLWQFERYTARTQIRVDFEHVGLEGRPCSTDIETATYRIVQEALTNVVRHAEADAVLVRIRVDQEELVLQVEDRGRGFDPTIVLMPGASSGLAGMHERTRLLAGRLRIESSPGAGTRILAELPLG
jgi:signal transduction histidine kinase